jgi:hypothetical protein
MGEQKNIVIINGKKYDASSGALLDAAVPSSQKLVSDFVAPAAIDQQAGHQRQPGHHLKHHKTQKSVTLKRAPRKKTSALASASLPMSSTEVMTIESNNSLLATSDRHERAKQVSKSHAISRFRAISQPTVNHEPLAVRPAPQSTPAFKRAAPAYEASSSTTSEDLFNKALGQADSHKQASHKISHRKHRVAKKLGLSPRAANTIAVMLVVVMLGGFIAYQNAPNIAMRVAASQSGLASASLPGYRPSGFSLSRRVSTSPGQVTISFHSNSDSRAFTVTQASSNWNSQALADSFLDGKQTQRYSSDGKTVYFYDSSNATWVDGGIWYRIEGNSSLSTDQLLKLANSF